MSIEGKLFARLCFLRFLLFLIKRVTARLRSREPEELLRSGEGIGVGTRRGGKVRERAGEGGRGLQIEIGVGPTQHQLVVQQLKIKARGRNARRVFDRQVIATAPVPRVPCYEHVAVDVHRNAPGPILAMPRPVVATGPQ